MDLPEWFLDELLNLPAPEIRILVILLKHSHQALAAQGVPAYKAALSASSLAREAKVSRAGAYRGLAHLEEIGLIEVHRSWKSREPTAFLIPWVRHPQEVIHQQRGPPVSPVRQRHTNKQLDRLKFETPLNNPDGGGDRGEGITLSLSTPTTMEEVQGKPNDSLTLATQLKEIGELHPTELLNEYGPERVETALRHLKSLPRSSVKNPPGMLRYLLSSNIAVPRNLEQHRSWDTDPNAHYYRGKYGHLVRGKVCPHTGQTCMVRGVDPDKCIPEEDCPNEVTLKLIRSGAGQPVEEERRS